MPASAPKNDSILNIVTTILTSRETVPIYWSVACFVVSTCMRREEVTEVM